MGPKWLKENNLLLIFSMLALTAVGVLFIYSASYEENANYEMRQMFWVSVGLILAFTVPMLGYRTFLSMSYLLYVISILLLIWVQIAGHTRYGAQRWINFGPIVIQPSEFAKLTTIMALSHFLGSNYSWEKENRIIAMSLGIVLFPMFLIMRQPDLGSAMMFVPMAIAILFVWGIRYRYIILAFVSGIVAAPLLWLVLKEYQKKRIQVFLNPSLDPLGAGYTAIQSKIAVGSGGLWGKGFLDGTQSQLNFVPEHHTDFIFCVIGEEWGYAGAVLLIGLFGLLFHALFQIISHTTDIKAKLMVAGIIAVLFTQVFVNIGMTIGLMPVKGIPLPLVSYGGSSYLATAIALGLALSIHKERSIF